jgi:hypothetical protein
MAGAADFSQNLGFEIVLPTVYSTKSSNSGTLFRTENIHEPGRKDADLGESLAEREWGVDIYILQPEA